MFFGENGCPRRTRSSPTRPKLLSMASSLSSLVLAFSAKSIIQRPTLVAWLSLRAVSSLSRRCFGRRLGAISVRYKRTASIINMCLVYVGLLCQLLKALSLTMLFLTISLLSCMAASSSMLDSSSVSSVSYTCLSV